MEVSASRTKKLVYIWKSARLWPAMVPQEGAHEKKEAQMMETGMLTMLASPV